MLTPLIDFSCRYAQLIFFVSGFHTLLRHREYRREPTYVAADDVFLSRYALHLRHVFGVDAYCLFRATFHAMPAGLEVDYADVTPPLAIRRAAPRRAAQRARSI